MISYILAAVHTTNLPLSILNEMTEDQWAWWEFHVVDVAVQRLIHSEHKLSHDYLCFLPVHPGVTPSASSLVEGFYVDCESLLDAQRSECKRKG
jgi:hypothetical protein